MSERLYGTLRHIHQRGAIRYSALRKVHGGTLNAILGRRWVQTYQQAGEEWVSLSDEGMEAFKKYASAPLSKRMHEADLTELALKRLALLRAHRRITKVTKIA